MIGILIGGLSSCKDPNSSQLSSPNQVILADHSMSWDEVGTWLTETDYAVVTDLATNRTAIINKGHLLDSWPSISGLVSSHSFSKSLTRLGVFSLHALDHCPPWFPSDDRKKSEAPCAEDNRLSRYAFWFDGYEYALHGYPNTAQDQDLFTSTDIKKRNYSRGCVVAPQEKLIELVDLLLSDPQLASHPGAILIHQARSSNDLSKKNINVFIPFTDAGGITAPWPSGLNHKKWTQQATLDAKLMVINTNHWSLSEANDLDRSFLTTEKPPGSSGTSLRLARNCLIRGTKPTFQYPSELTEQYKVGRLNSGDLLVGVPPGDLSSQTGLNVIIPGTRSTNPTASWLPLSTEADRQLLDCLPQLYWHSSPEEASAELIALTTSNSIVSSSHSIRRQRKSQPWGSAAEASPSLNTPLNSWENLPRCSVEDHINIQREAQGDAQADPKDLNKLTQSDLFKFINCLRYGGGTRGCSKKHSCTLNMGSRSACMALTQIAYRGLPPPPEKDLDRMCGSS